MIIAVIVAYSFVAVIILSPAQNPILPCSWDGEAFYPSNTSSDPMAIQNEEPLSFPWQEPLHRFCQKCGLMQAWLCLISL